jgi:hypothetical protein
MLELDDREKALSIKGTMAQVSVLWNLAVRTLFLISAQRN